MTSHLFAALLILSAPAVARAMSADFPDGSTPLSSDELRARISDKTFSVRPAAGPEWRWTLRKDGYFFIHVGHHDGGGTWKVQEGRLCSTRNGGRPGNCNEVRAKDGTLYLKRDSGEIVNLVPQ